MSTTTFVQHAAPITDTADVVICGAGIAGIAAAHALAVGQGVRNVMLVDERSPMTLTSDKSTEAYRNWWPGPDDAMVRFMSRSIDLLESWARASDNRFLMNRRGYMYTTASAAKGEQFLADGHLAEAQGAGPLRVYRSSDDAVQYMASSHTGFEQHPTGADLFLDHSTIREYFPFLADDIVAVLHTRRCGWLSGQQLGMQLLDEAKAAGVTVVNGRIDAVGVTGNRVTSVRLRSTDGTSRTVATEVFVNAAGPFAKQVSALIDVDLPLYSELHLKVSFEDTLGVIDRNTGLVILDDAQVLPWSDDDRLDLAADGATRWMTEPLPAGIHCRPDGYHQSTTVLMLWDYHSAHRYDTAQFPFPDDPHYPEIAMRGLVRLAPGLQRYVDHLPHSVVDGGYYTKTVENRPLIGPLAVEGAYVCAGFSGFGLMAAPAAAELLAAQITGGSRPSYEPAFLLSRYDSDSYRDRLTDWGATGQL